MTASEQNKGDAPRDNAIAAEYVLGVLSFTDRKKVETRILTDDAFARLVQNWETHFSGLNSAYEPDTPPAATLAKIEKRLFGTPHQSKASISGLWSSLAFWRGMTAMASAAAALVVLVSAFNVRTPEQPTRMSYMAELSSPDVPMAVMVAYNAHSGKMVLTPMAAGENQQKSLELWLVNADGTPHSLGVVDPHKDAEMVVPVKMRDQLKDGMTLAVSLEPYGGSPTGKPTGPVLASGTTRQL
ncbi:anti-sigma-K factor RskA [Rhizobium skierniewicense]|uniref:Anti-sigma-K factor RskA n=1 Tax=Rhizobium skierniewicense TaxID=984260 RepID=A0A7W6C657_9HYPH|nr:anti-sigma factor [Rhizobium skierniewicense]MBB3946467.1 anti-sigma-K factor RskA [Rhizobium skierniewicense]